MDPLNQAILCAGGGALPTLVNYANTYTGNNSTSLNCTIPTGTQDGDLMLAFLSANGGANSVGNWTAPAGWTFAVEKTDDTWVNLAVAYKVAASEGATATFTSNNSCKLNITLVTYANAAWSTIGTAAKGNSNTSTATGITIPDDNSILFHYHLDNDGSSRSSASGLTTLVNSPGTQTSHLITADVFPSGSTGSKTVSLGASKVWGTVLLSISPA